MSYNAYGGAAAAPYYAQQPQAMPQYQQQQQQQQHQQFPGYYPPNSQPPAFDENGFRSLYAQRLGALTINSRPIIQDLSMLAQNNPQMAHIVVECIERQVRAVGLLSLARLLSLTLVLQMAPPFKLPLFYLLDSIAKNAFEPYAAAFTSRIVRLFLDTYHAVDQQTQHKMREMMVTWRNGSPTNRELFGPGVQSEIERVWGLSLIHI